MLRFSNIILATGLLCLINLGSGAFAQHPFVLQRLKEWNAAAPSPSPGTLLAQVKIAAQQKYPENGSCLAQGIMLVAVEPATADRYVFTEVAFGRMKNAWTATVRHDGCDNAPVRYMVMQKADGQMSAIRVNRGVSYAHDSLIGDTFPYVALAAHPVLDRAGIKCNTDAQAKLGVIRIEKEDTDLGPSVFGIRYIGSWTEVWPIELCKRIVEVPVRFTADGDGGARYNAQGSRAALLPLSGN